MTGLAPEISVLAIALGLVFALVCYLATNLSPGGMITPGWLALVFIVQPSLGFPIAVVVVTTYALIRGLQQVVILYGKRLFATVVLVAVFLQITLFLFLVKATFIFELTTLGFIVPGLIAYQLLRQPILATLTSTAAVTMLTYSVVLAGILLQLVPVESTTVAARGLAAEPSAAFSSLQLGLSAVGVLVVLTLVAWQLRRVTRLVAPSRRRFGAGAVALERRGAYGRSAGAEGHDERGPVTLMTRHRLAASRRSTRPTSVVALPAPERATIGSGSRLSSVPRTAAARSGSASPTIAARRLSARSSKRRSVPTPRRFTPTNGRATSELAALAARTRRSRTLGMSGSSQAFIPTPSRTSGRSSSAPSPAVTTSSRPSTCPPT